jgi:hypothetical protein
MSLRLAAFLILLTFSATLAIVVGLRLPEQALVVLVGVAAGAAASLPTSFLVFWLTSGRRAREPERPQVILVPQPPAPAQLPDPRAALPPLPPPDAEDRRRTFTIIGGDPDTAL